MSRSNCSDITELCICLELHSERGASEEKPARSSGPSGPSRRQADRRTMAPSLIPVCRSLALSTWLLSFCFVHLLCLDFTVAEKEEWYTAFVNITYLDPVTSELRTEKTECGRYGEHSPKKEVRGLVLVPPLLQDRQVCDLAARFPAVPRSTAWVALVAAGNCTYREKIRNAAKLNASAVVIYNVGSSGANDTITMPHPGERHPAELPHPARSLGTTGPV